MGRVKNYRTDQVLGFSSHLYLTRYMIIVSHHRIGGLICHSLVAWSPWFYIFII